MALKTVEGRSAGKRSRPSVDVHRQIDTSEIASAPYAIKRLQRRFGLSAEAAVLIASLAYPATDSWRVQR